MTVPTRNRKALAWAAALVTAAFVSIALGRPREVANPLLGGEWKCRQMAFLTSCALRSPGQHGLRVTPTSFRQG